MSAASLAKRLSHALVLSSAALSTSACGAGPQQEDAVETETAPQIQCLEDGSGFLRARLTGAIESELDWGNDGTECSGAVRPTDGGVRLRFSRAGLEGDSNIALVFGIAGLPEGKAARTLPVNVTVIREGEGEFFSTQGDDKCMLDEIAQTPIVGIPHRTRSYRVVARGFCTEPARAVRGIGAVLLSRFDFAGRIDFETEDSSDDPQMARQ